jgi:hypothetical protein
MKRRPDFAALLQLAHEQDNVVARPQLLAAHFSDEWIALAVNRHIWTGLQRGVYLLSPGPATWEQRARAAQYAGADGVALDGASALRWRGIDATDDDVVTVAMTGRQGGSLPEGVVLHYPSRALTIQEVRGVRAVSVEDALLGFAAACRNRRKVEVAVESALLNGLTAERRIWQCVARNSRRGVRGVALLRSVMDNRPLGKPSRSILELELLDLIRSSDLPMPTRNVEVIDANGDHREIDLCYLPQKGAIEADSRRWHGTESQQANDARRQAALEAVGFEFVRVTWPDVMQRPSWVLDQIRQLLARVVAA